MYMGANVSKINLFLFFKLPAAWWTGVRMRALDDEKAEVSVKHRWVNQNPFRSMYWAVQGMAAELSTGVLVSRQIAQTGKPISMLVASNKGSFSKKATGRITFTCEDGNVIREALNKTIKTGEGQTFWMNSRGVNKEGITVSDFSFEWTVKLKSSKQ